MNNIISWKGRLPNAMTTMNLKPNTNRDPTVYKHGLARPLKIYRKGFVNKEKYVRSSLVGYHNQFIPSANSVNKSDFGGQTVTNILPIYSLTETPSEIGCGLNEKDCICCGQVSKAKKRVLPPNTNVSKKYYQSKFDYLYARCQTFEQRQFNYEKDLSGYYVAQCNRLDDNKGCDRVYYKPNNQQFAQQGAVSSSTRTLKLNVDTIQSQRNINTFYKDKDTKCINPTCR